MSASVFDAAVLGSMCEWGSMSRMESSSVKRRSRSWEDMCNFGLRISDCGFVGGVSDADFFSPSHDIGLEEASHKELSYLLSVAFVTVGAGLCRFAVGGAGLVVVVEVYGGRDVARGLLQLA